MWCIWNSGDTHPTQDFSDHPVPLHVLALDAILAVGDHLQLELAVAAALVGQLHQQVGDVAGEVFVFRRVVRRR